MYIDHLESCRSGKDPVATEQQSNGIAQADLCPAINSRSHLLQQLDSTLCKRERVFVELLRVFRDQHTRHRLRDIAGDSLLIDILRRLTIVLGLYRLAKLSERVL